MRHALAAAAGAVIFEEFNGFRGAACVMALARGNRLFPFLALVDVFL
jgi:hypothetical protein